ncbi:transposase [Streptomyces sp. NRRL B-1347]|uniref:transposase n=1 Tax=Streptomyces sp. NRRL B-1347 TaxID=1476877 RepID=UPI003B63EB9E
MAKHPDRIPATYHRTAGISHFHGCYSLGDDTLWGMVHRRKGADLTLATLRSVRTARPDGEPIYVILDNWSGNKTRKIRRWAARPGVALSFTPTNASWANPIEPHFGPLRSFVLGNDIPSSPSSFIQHLHAYLHWRNSHQRTPDVLEARRRERARIKGERGHRSGRPHRTAA